MIKNILSDIFSGYSSFGERCLVAFIALLMLAVIGLLGLLAFVIVDSVGITPAKTVVTTVEVKQVVPAYTTTILVGKVLVPQYHPESYKLHFKIDGEDISSTIKKKFFNDINVGDRIEVNYGFGRLSNSHQPIKIRLVDR